MTESEWRKSKDGDALLAVVADRLTPRKWALLACAVARRVLHLLPETPFHEAVDFAERHRPAIDNMGWAAWRQAVEDGVQDARFEAERKQREVVKSCDPDALVRPGPPVDTDREPAAPLLRAASENAAASISAAVDAAEHASSAVQSLFEAVGVPRFARVRGSVREAEVALAESNVLAGIAFEMSRKADRIADAPPTRRHNIQFSIAMNAVEQATDEAETKCERVRHQKETAETAALAHLLREQFGNPFDAYPFDPAWRTETVVALAAGIEEERAFDRMPILADALEEAGCDERAVLDHLRGPGPHARGCWVLDLILDRDPDLFALPPIVPTPPRMQLGPFTPPPGNVA